MYRFVIALLGVLFLSSCDNTFESPAPSEDLRQSFRAESVRLLKERDPNCPWKPYTPADGEAFSSESRADGEPEDYLGCGWNGNNFWEDVAEKSTYPVIDMDQLRKDHPSYWGHKSLFVGVADLSTYTTFEQYSRLPEISDKISEVLPVHLNYIAQGAAARQTELFSPTFTQEPSSVFGELNLQYKAHQYTLQMSSQILENIRLHYLHAAFKEKLYHAHPSELFATYGGFVLKDIFTGGRAVALYAGQGDPSTSASEQEKNMAEEIAASYGYATDGTAAGQLGIGKHYAPAATTTGKIADLQVSVKTIGGTPVCPTFSTPQEIEAVDINLSAWLSSLSETETHALIDVAEGGLLPITAFIPEENLKEMMELYYKTGVAQVESLQEPYLLFAVRPIQSPFLFSLGVILVDRYGESFLLEEKGTTSDNLPEIQEEAVERYGKIFGLKMVQAESMATKALVLQGGTIDLTKARKVIDQDNPEDTIYLLCEKTYSDSQENIAFTLHGDQVIRDYAMQTYLSSLPTINMAIEDIIQKYTLRAL